MSSIRESIIREYISGIDFKNDDWKLSVIKNDLKRALGEEPAVNITYKKDVMINESGESKEFLDVNKVEIVFTDDNDGFKKIEFDCGRL
jgi:hypothetical protein